MTNFTHIKQRQFTRDLAALKPKLRYITAKRRWYAARLGLYLTISQYSSWLPVKTRRDIVVSTIANIKRQSLTDDVAKSCIEHILYHKRYRQFRNELIRDTISFYPEIIFDFLKTQLGDIDNLYYQGLYIALLKKYYPLDSNAGRHLDKFLLYKSDGDYVDKQCLYSNITLDAPLTKLANLNKMFTHHQLSQIKLADDQQQFTVTNLTAVEQLTNHKKPEVDHNLYKVTVIVTAYNASETIDSCITSLLQQTWANLEIIVVDDASTDNTLLRLQKISEQSGAIKIIALPKNVGTFAAKSIGVQYATSEFLTCQDSDDWAHPQKIAEQVQPLIEDSNIIATTSHWLRLDQNSQYYVRQIYPFMRQNPASPMFRLQTVKQETGLWHIVRTGADSEFFERLKLVFGSEKVIVIKKPLTVASHRPNSLMTSEQFGIYNRTAALSRLDYWEAWRLWHIDTLYHKSRLVMPSIQQQANATQAVFAGVPDSIKVDIPSLEHSLSMHTVLGKY